MDLIFEEGGRYYKVYRSPEYPRAKARSEGFTSEKSKANMMRIAGDYEAEFRSLIDEVPQNDTMRSSTCRRVPRPSPPR